MLYDRGRRCDQQGQDRQREQVREREGERQHRGFFRPRREKQAASTSKVKSANAGPVGVSFPQSGDFRQRAGEERGL